MNVDSANSVAKGLKQFGEACKAAGLAMAAFTATWQMEVEIPIRAGEWPDEFVLLNRWQRTRYKPKYLSGERWES